MVLAPGRAGWFAAAFALGAQGCLWIDPASHDDREALLAFELGDLRIAPVGLAACLPTQGLLTVDAPVGLQHDGEVFAVSTRFGDAEDVEQGAITAVNGALTFAVDATGWQTDPVCADGCTRRLVVTATRLGVQRSANADVPLIGPATPAVGAVTLIDPGGAETPLDAVPRKASPNDAILAADWPTLAIEVEDPHLVLGTAGRVAIWACPGVATPDTPGGGCVSEPAVGEGDAPTDPRRFTVPTAALADGICGGGVIDPTWRLYARIEQHPCGGPYTFALSPSPVVLVDPDCDGDGFEAGADCDDLADTVFPGAIEVCDGLDNDCAGGEGTQAATVFPAGGGAPTNVAGPSEAVAAAQGGDTVGVCPGSYAVDLVLGKSLSLVGAGDADAVVLTSKTPGRSVVSVGLIDPPADVTLEALTVTGASGVAVGGGVDARNAGSLLLDRCVVTGNGAARGGGAAIAGEVTVRSTRIEANDAQEGGGLAIDPGADVSFAAATIASNTADRGGGLHVDGVGDAVSLGFDAGSLVVTNRAPSGAGGGLWATGLASISGGRFTGNEAAAGGGLAFDAGALPLGSAIITVDGVDLQSNRADSDGGGVFATGPLEATLVGCAFQLDAAGAHGGGLAATDGALVTISGGSFDTNAADADGGGAFAAGATLEIDESTFATNLALRGGAVALVDAEATFGAVTPVDLSANTAYDAGGAVYAHGGTLNYASGAVSGNVAASGGGFAVDQGVVVFGGSLADSQGFGFVVSGGGVLTVDAGATLADNGDDRVDAGVAEVCLGAQVDELVASAGGDSGGDADCFVVTEAGYTDGCTCP